MEEKPTRIWKLIVFGTVAPALGVLAFGAWFACATGPTLPPIPPPPGPNVQDWSVPAPDAGVRE